MDTAKISQLFRKQIPPGQHNCSERDMTRNEKPWNLVLSLTLMSSEDLWVSLPVIAGSVHITVIVQRVWHPTHYLRRLCERWIIWLLQNLLTATQMLNVSYLLVTGTPSLKGGNLICSGCPHCTASPNYFIIFLQSYGLQVACGVERTADWTPTATWNLCSYFSVCIPKH